jgi:hypothetical protein
MAKKIDLYRVRRNERGRITSTEYVCSTNWSRTIREAVGRFHEINNADAVIGNNVVPYHAEMKGQFA